MRTKSYKVYVETVAENSLNEKIRGLNYLKDIELFILKKGKSFTEKQGIETETTVYNALAYNIEGIKEGMYIEVNDIKYKIKNISDFGHKVFLELRED